MREHYGRDKAAQGFPKAALGWFKGLLKVIGLRCPSLLCIDIKFFSFFILNFSFFIFVSDSLFRHGCHLHAQSGDCQGLADVCLILRNASCPEPNALLHEYQQAVVEACQVSAKCESVARHMHCVA